MIKKDLQLTEYSQYFGRYLKLVSDETALKTGLIADKKMVTEFFLSIPKDKLSYRYQVEKWTVKEILQHIIDTERIFMYRLLRIARQDKTPLIGFNQDIYIAPSQANNKSLTELLEEFTITRLYSINLINSISTKNLMNLAIADNENLSARACAFILLGHSLWHINIIKNRYL